MSEQIKYDEETEEYFIERSTMKGHQETFERLSLGAWNFEKQITVYIHVKREIQSTDFENPVQVINYSLPLTYTILNTEQGKHTFIKREPKVLMFQDETI